MVKFSCKKCGQKLNVEDKHSGKRVKCPKCGSIRVVPDNSDKIKFDCKNCGHKISVPQIHAGKKGKCPKCKNPVVVPSLNKGPADGAETFSIVCSMCDETVQVPETSRGQTVRCPECGGYIETSSGGVMGESDASWSPDGKQIAFESNADIYVMNADGSEQKRLTNNRDGVTPSWSPDGKKIAFMSQRDGNHEIYVMNADGTEQKRLTHNPALDMFPFWSPDGKKIAFISERDGNWEIYVMNADGSEQINLTNNPARDDAERGRRGYWSPDSKKIAFRSERDGNFEIYVVNADGSKLKRLTNNRGFDVTPSWSPDGKKIAFQSNAHIYVMNADGSKRERLTNNPVSGIQPSWSPFISSEPQLVEEPEREQKSVDDTVSRPQPVTSDTQPEEPVEAVPLPKPGDVVGDAVTNSIGMKLVYIPAGSFMMGSPSREEGRFTNEGPQHLVHISKGFWMGQTEVTQGQYKSVMDAQPWSGRSGRSGVLAGRFGVKESANNPAVYVTWDDANDFCTKLSQQEGKTYRLPTEAEWEYACRAGTTTRFSFGDSYSSLGDYAWFKGNAFKVGQRYAHPVGQKKPNPWRLYDMHGNVWEWCSDWYAEGYNGESPRNDPTGTDTGSYRVFRGGGWNDPQRICRSAYRNAESPSDRYFLLGFRVARSFVSK